MKPDLTVAEFCDLHDACDDGRTWALANCDSMATAWKTLKHDWLLWAATRKGVLTDKELRLFAVWSAREVQHLMTDPRSIAALDVAERYAIGNASDEELAAARDAARAAARAAARDAAWAAAWAAARAAAWAAARAAAWAAARAAAWAAAWAAARAAAWAAARDAARDAARAAAWDAAGDAQGKWLRENTKPNFTGAPR